MNSEEKEKNRDEMVEQLRNELMIRNIGDKNLYSDAFLLNFMLCKNFNIEECCEMIYNYVDMFKKYPQLFEGIEYCKRPFEDGLFQILPGKNITGETVILIQPGLWNPNEYSFQQAMTTAIYGTEFNRIREEMDANKVIAICDVGDFKLKHFFSYKISDIKLAAFLAEKSLPIALRKVIIAFQNPLIDIFYAITKPFLSEELNERFLFIGSDMTKLHEFVPPELLPPKYGGSFEQYDHIEYYKILKENESLILSHWKSFKDYHMKK